MSKVPSCLSRVSRNSLLTITDTFSYYSNKKYTPTLYLNADKNSYDSRLCESIILLCGLDYSLKRATHRVIILYDVTVMILLQVVIQRRTRAAGLVFWHGVYVVN